MAGGDQPVRKVCIVGGGTAGWMTAAVLSQWLSQVEVTLVESEEIGTVGVGEATIPHIRNYLALAGIDPLKMISETKATFKLGIQFVGLGRGGGELYPRLRQDRPRHAVAAPASICGWPRSERPPGSVKHFDIIRSTGAASLRKPLLPFPTSATRIRRSPISNMPITSTRLCSRGSFAAKARRGA